jgi:predicted phage tail protein
MKCKVHLHGYLAAFHDGPVEMMGDTVAEIIEGLTRQIPGFRPDPIHGRHRIAVVGYDRIEDVYSEPKSEELHIVPQLAGGKKGGLVQIIVGAVLLALSFTGLNATLASIMFSMGVSMLLGGIAQLLAPQPNTEDEKKSRYLGAPKNTVAIGTRIPILYGEYRVYGHYLSFNVNSIETDGS